MPRALTSCSEVGRNVGTSTIRLLSSCRRLQQANGSAEAFEQRTLCALKVQDGSLLRCRVFGGCWSVAGQQRLCRVRDHTVCSSTVLRCISVKASGEGAGALPAAFFFVPTSAKWTSSLSAFESKHEPLRALISTETHRRLWGPFFLVPWSFTPLSGGQRLSREACAPRARAEILLTKYGADTLSVRNRHKPSGQHSQSARARGRVRAS